MWLAVVSTFASFVVLGIGGLLMVTLLPQIGELGPWTAALAEIIFMGLMQRWRFKSNKWMRIDIFKRRGAEMPPEIGQIID